MRQSSYKGFGYVLEETVAPRNIGRLLDMLEEEHRPYQCVVESAGDRDGRPPKRRPVRLRAKTHGSSSCSSARSGDGFLRRGKRN